MSLGTLLYTWLYGNHVGSDQFNNKRIGIILTGGNVDIDKLPW